METYFVTEISILLVFLITIIPLVIIIFGAEKLISLYPAFPWGGLGFLLSVLFLLASWYWLMAGIYDRQLGKYQPASLHDSVLQMEVALDNLWQKGLSPYEVDYLGTKLETFEYRDLAINPALYHFAYLPGVLILSTPVYLLSQRVAGFYDQRLTQVFFWLVLWLLVLWRYRFRSQLIILFLLLCLNFLFLLNVKDGLNDIIVLTLVMLALELTLLKKYTGSAIIFGLALSTKQTAWFALPFLSQFIWLRLSDQFTDKLIHLKIFYKWLITSIITALVVILPFLLKNPTEFVADTIGYQTGWVENSFHIKGIGLAQLLYLTGFIKQITDYFPFWLLQLIVGLVGGWLMWRYQKKKGAQPWIVLCLWSLWLGSVWWFNRYFSLTHLNFLLMVASLGYFYKGLSSGQTANKL